MAKTLNSRIPEGPVAEKWTNYKAHQRLVNPKNKLKLDVIVVGTGLAGASAAASLGEMGFNILNFCIQDSPRRAHSIAAQGGINAAKNYQNDGDSVYRLFYDTVKGGDYRAREANVYRLAEVSNDIIDQCVAQGVPFAREYGGMLANRSFGGAQVSRTFDRLEQNMEALVQRISGRVHQNGVLCLPQRSRRPVGVLFIPLLKLRQNRRIVHCLPPRLKLLIAAARPVRSLCGEKQLYRGVRQDLRSDVPTVHHDIIAPGHVPLHLHQKSADLREGGYTGSIP